MVPADGPAEVTAKPPTMYLATARDKDGNLLQAGKTYALTVPAEVPINIQRTAL